MFLVEVFFFEADFFLVLCFPAVLLVPAVLFAEVVTAGTVNLFTTVPVSYTHLDVYKRQGKTWKDIYDGR